MDHESPNTESNALLPAVILFGSLVLSAFVPAMLLFALGALIWLAGVAFRRRKMLELVSKRLDRQHEQLRVMETSTQRVDAIINASDIPIIAVGDDACITHANTAAIETLAGGRTPTGNALDELITHRAVHELAEQAMGGEPGHTRFSLPVGGHTHAFDVAADPINNGQGCVLTFHDITELTTAVALKADFAANASHELRTPIASIRGAVDTLSGAAQSDEGMRSRLIEIIDTNATRLELMVNDLLDLSKIESADAPPVITCVDIRALVERITEQFGAICARRSLTIETAIDESLHAIDSDRSLVELILRNLVENATKFANEGTTVRVSVKPSEIAPSPGLAIPAALDAPLGIRVEVRDKGIGIPLGDQQRVFERFYQVDDARSGSGIKRGTGLGLAIVKHACRRLGGSIEMKSVYGQGTTMSVSLPKCARIEPNADQRG